jgi:Tfp pilus assembly protein PilO
MERITLKRLLWEARRQTAMLGWLGALGVGLVVFAVAFRFSAVAALHSELDDLREEAERLRARYHMALKQPGGVKPGPAQQLRTFYEFFPPRATLPDWLSRVYIAADKTGVRLESGEYRLVQERGWRLARYQVTLPIRGSYEQIRGFIAEVLNEIPAAAIDDVGLKRENIGSTTIEARIRFTLFMGQGES